MRHEFDRRRGHRGETDIRKPAEGVAAFDAFDRLSIAHPFPAIFVTYSEEICYMTESLHFNAHFMLDGTEAISLIHRTWAC